MNRFRPFLLAALVAATAILPAAADTLDVAWRVPLGSGYSGIVAADGRAVTMYADGDADVMAAFDLATGKRLWRVPLGATYKGHDGSDDGPLSSPVIADGVVYGLGPRGTLVAVSLKDGSTVWSTSLTDAFGAKEPEFGFTTTPVVAGDVLVVLTGGGDGRAISGLDRRSGKPRWSIGDGAIEYQSPAVMTLGGREQVVAVSGKRLLGLEPVDGRVLWSQQLADDARTSSSTPTSAGENRVLFFAGGEAFVYAVDADEGDFTVSEAYRTKELGGTYALPVHHDGHLYGFKRQFLTCIDAVSGERRWKSRPPGGRGLRLVDDRLVIFGAEGNVVVARATPAAYEEAARVQALDGSGYTWPAVAGERVLVRNLDEMAAVMLTSAKQAAPAVGAAARSLPDGELASLVDRVEALSRESASLVESYLARHDRSPIVESGHAHFVYRGDAADVAVEGTMIASGQAQLMARLPGSDLFYASFPVEPGTRHEYRFVVDFDTRIADPRNPHTVPGRWGDSQMSELVLPGYVAPSHIAEPSGERGTIETLEFGDETLGTREIKVWLPSGYATSKARHPLLIVHGTDYLDKGLMANTLDNLVGRRVRPLIAVFVPSHPEWWTEAGGARTEAWVDALANDLVPMLEARYRLRRDPASRGVMGFGGFGLTAAFAAARHPDVFGKAAAQSPMITLGLEDTMLARLPETRGKKLQFYVDWNRYGGTNIDTGLDLAEQGARLMRAIEGAGHRCAGGERMDADGWGSRRAANEQILAAFFPVKR